MDLELLLYSIKIGIAMILNCSIETAEDITLIAIQVELEPTGVLYVCLGGPLRTNCSVSSMTINDETVLEWSITSRSHPTTQTRSIVGDSTHGDNTTVMVALILVNLTTLNISRSFPLNSMIFTDHTIADLNGSMITCSAQDFGSGAMVSASVQIILIGNNQGAVNITPNVNISQSFEANGVTVALEWDAKNGVSYIVSVQPEVLVDYTRTNSAQLSLPYGKQYNISVIASLCGRNRTTSSVCRYERCPSPVTEISSVNIIISNYEDPPIEGTIITLSCLHGLILTGSDNVYTARCYQNGSWIPNPSGHACATSSAVSCGDPVPPSGGFVEPYTSTVEGARITYTTVIQCTNGERVMDELVCLSEGMWKAVSDSIKFCNTTVTTYTDPIDFRTFVIIGGSLGSFLGVVLCCIIMVTLIIIAITRQKDTEVSSSGDQKSGQSKSQNPVYEEVMASRSESGHDAVEMMQNVAYGPLQL